MADCSQLPTWVSYSQALAVPALAAVGAWIAARQMLIADEKLRNEVFDRRYERRLAFFHETSGIVEKILKGSMSEDDLRAYNLKCQEARFLFDKPMHIFIDEMTTQARLWHEAGESLKTARSQDIERLSAIIKDQERWFMILTATDHRHGLDVKFRPYLVQTPPKRPWLLRWP